MILFHLILISLVVCFIVDVSGIVDSVKHLIWSKWIKVGDYHQLHFPPFDCSLCMTFWSGLIYLLVTPGAFTIPYIAFVALLSLLSSKITGLEIFVQDLVDKGISLLYKLIGL